MFENMLFDCRYRCWDWSIQPFRREGNLSECSWERLVHIVEQHFAGDETHHHVENANAFLAFLSTFYAAPAWSNSFVLLRAVANQAWWSALLSFDFAHNMPESNTLIKKHQQTTWFTSISVMFLMSITVSWKLNVWFVWDDDGDTGRYIEIRSRADRGHWNVGFAKQSCLRLRELLWKTRVPQSRNCMWKKGDSLSHESIYNQSSWFQMITPVSLEGTWGNWSFRVA